MKILITSGGTSQPIDSVRSVTNRSTGQLGAFITNNFLKAGHEVTLVTTPSASKPEEHSALTLVLVETVSDVYDILQRLVPVHDALIHAMAISDYDPIRMLPFEAVAQAENLTDLLKKDDQIQKISSKPDVQVLFLQKTPKIISMVKSWNPDILLIGFKLLVAAPKDELLTVARDSLHKNQADMIVANDLQDIKGKQTHIAYLVTEQTHPVYHNKAEIAQAIYDFVKEKRG